MRWFPLVGLAIGAMLAALDRSLALFFPEQIVALLLVAALAVVSGALHLDGLADVFDGFGARGGRERFLAVMKDSGTGAIGVVALVLGLLLKYQALLHLPAKIRCGIMIFPAAARFAQVLLTARSLRARDDGLGATFATGAGYKETAIAAVTRLLPACCFSALPGLYAAWSLPYLPVFPEATFMHRLGGITGDIIGAPRSWLKSSASLLSLPPRGV